MTETTFKSKKLEEPLITGKSKRPSTRVITLRVKPELYEDLSRQAAKQNIPLADYVKAVLSESVERDK